jgi:hypothetical protein
MAGVAKLMNTAKSVAVHRISQTPPLVEEGTPFQNTWVVLEQKNIRPWDPTGPETKNECASEAQQQITALLINIGAAYGNVFEFGRCKETWIGLHRL